MKNIFILFLIVYHNHTFGQKLDSNIIIKDNTSKYNFNDFGVKFKIRKRYKKISPHNPSLHRSDVLTCLPRNFYDPIINKKFREHYIIYFYLNNILPPIEQGSIMKKIAPDWTPNNNYIGSKFCEDERRTNLIQIYNNEDFEKFKSDTALCIRVDSTAVLKSNENFTDLIYVILHKDNISDVYVCFAYKKEYEFEVINEIRKLWKLIKFK
jgi:hypothetical protein